MLTSIKKYEMPQLVYDFLFRELPYKKVTVQKVVISLRRPTKEEYHKIPVLIRKRLSLVHPRKAASLLFLDSHFFFPFLPPLKSGIPNHHIGIFQAGYPSGKPE
jgi:hypothetical protein